jgi:hypothetical protein
MVGTVIIVYGPRFIGAEFRKRRADDPGQPWIVRFPDLPDSYIVRFVRHWLPFSGLHYLLLPANEQGMTNPDVGYFFCQDQAGFFDQFPHIIGMIHLAAAIGNVCEVKGCCMKTVC